MTIPAGKGKIKMAFNKKRTYEFFQLTGYSEERSMAEVFMNYVLQTKEIQIVPSMIHENDEFRFRTSTGSFLHHRPFSTSEIKYFKDWGCPCGVFHAEAAQQPIFAVTEGVYDALSLDTVGIPSLALLGTGNRYFFDLLESLSPSEHVILLCLDNDPAGRRGSERLRNRLEKDGGWRVLNVTPMLRPLCPDGSKDPNDFLVHHEAAFISHADFVLKEAKRMLNLVHGN
jgi:hypothetical protein